MATNVIIPRETTLFQALRQCVNELIIGHSTELTCEELVYGLYREVAGIELPDIDVALDKEDPEASFDEYVRKYSALWRPIDTKVEALRLMDVAFFCTSFLREATHVALVCSEYEVVTSEAGDRARRVGIRSIESLNSLRWIRYIGPGANKL